MNKKDAKSNPDGKSSMYIGMDLHKNYLQIAAIDKDGHLLHNSKINNDPKSIDAFFDGIDRNAKVVMESSSVWYDAYCRIAEKGFDVTLSNPIKTKAIASAKIKTDKIDAKILADLLRGGYIAQCYVPDRRTMDLRELVRHREFLVRQRTNLKNKIHGILLLSGIRIQGTPFSQKYNKGLQKLGNYRISDYLKMIETLDLQIDTITKRIQTCVKEDRSANLLTTIPGIGYYSALLIASEIGDISRFPDSHRLCSYAGLVPSTRSSGGTTYHGKITKPGSRHMRWVVTECVHSHIRYQNSNITRFYDRIAKKKGKAKATVAAASKMLRIIYWILKENREYQNIP